MRTDKRFDRAVVRLANALQEFGEAANELAIQEEYRRRARKAVKTRNKKLAQKKAKK